MVTYKCPECHHECEREVAPVMLICGSCEIEMREIKERESKSEVIEDGKK